MAANAEGHFAGMRSGVWEFARRASGGTEIFPIGTRRYFRVFPIRERMNHGVCAEKAFPRHKLRSNVDKPGGRALAHYIQALRLYKTKHHCRHTEGTTAPFSWEPSFGRSSGKPFTGKLAAHFKIDAVYRRNGIDAKQTFRARRNGMSRRSPKRRRSPLQKTWCRACISFGGWGAIAAQTVVAHVP